MSTDVDDTGLKRRMDFMFRSGGKILLHRIHNTKFPDIRNGTSHWLPD